MLRTNVELDERLVKEALRLTHMKTKKELVNYALKEVVAKIKRKKLLDLEGKVQWTGNFDQLRESRT